MSQFLNLLPKEMEPGDQWEDRVFDHFHEVENPVPDKRLDCCVVFRDGTAKFWHTAAPVRIYRP